GGICEFCGPPIELGNGGAEGICELCGPPIELNNVNDEALTEFCVLTFRTESNDWESLVVLRFKLPVLFWIARIKVLARYVIFIF
ncbi:hypothetical protein, partial [Providencia alcalifaciens]|uniref:hypothetical protein n=1 Tax=Providencia alcalifaciens TaxID=126385 RepID=UPI001E498C9B